MRRKGRPEVPYLTGAKQGALSRLSRMIRNVCSVYSDDRAEVQSAWSRNETEIEVLPASLALG